MTSLALHLVIGFRPARHGFASAVTAFLAADNVLICFGNPAFALPEGTRVLRDQAVGRDREHLQSDIYASFQASKRKRLERDAFTRETDKPTIHLPADGDGLGRPQQRTMEPNSNVANLGQAEQPAI